jgi:hypothetical protein
MIRVKLCLASLIAFALLIAIDCPLSLGGQRMSDKDLERMMTNLHNDSKRFRDAFDPAIGKSTIRKTQQEKDAKTLVQTFEDQTNKMLDQFKQNRQAEPALTSVRDSANRIEKLLADVPMGSQVNDAWAKVKTELATVSDAFKGGG